MRWDRRRGVIWGLIVLLAWAPLPLGSDGPLPWTVLALATGLLLLAWAAVAAGCPVDSVLSWRRIRPGIAGLALVVTTIFVQVAPFTPSDWHHPMWIEALAVLGEAAGRVSIAPYATTTALMRLLTYAGVFWLAVQLSRAPGGAQLLIRALVAIGVAYAVYGLLAHTLWPDMILWWPRGYETQVLTSTFICRGCYAAYAGLGLLCATGLAHVSARRDLSAGVRRLRASTWFWIAGAIVLAVALTLTESRTGVAAGGVGLAALMVSLAMARSARRRDSLFAALVVATLAAGVLVTVGNRSVDRIVSTQIEDEARFTTTYPPIVAAIADAPWLGVGYGTFGEAIAIYRGQITNLLLKAHNTFLEIALELGILASLILVGAVASLAWRCLRKLPRRRTGLYPALGVATTVFVTVFGLTDYGAELAAVALTYCTILGVAVGRADRITRSRAAIRCPPWRNAPHRVDLALAAIMGLALLGLGGPRLAGQVGEMVMHQMLDRARQVEPSEFDRAIALGVTTVGWAGDPDIRVRLAGLLFWNARAPGLPADTRRERLILARHLAYQAARSAPANAMAWLTLSRAAERLEPGSAIAVPPSRCRYWRALAVRPAQGRARRLGFGASWMSERGDWHQRSSASACTMGLPLCWPGLRAELGAWERSKRR